MEPVLVLTSLHSQQMMSYYNIQKKTGTPPKFIKILHSDILINIDLTQSMVDKLKKITQRNERKRKRTHATDNDKFLHTLYEEYIKIYENSEPGSRNPHLTVPKYKDLFWDSRIKAIVIPESVFKQKHSELLKCHFNHGKFNSFAAQLVNYGFKKTDKYRKYSLNLIVVCRVNLIYSTTN